MHIQLDDLQSTGVIELLQAHLADMYATSPPESVHALDIDALKHPSITFWCAKQHNVVLGCVAIKELNKAHGEIKSMRTAAAARNQGVATALLLHLLSEAKRRGYQQLSLETGSMDFFAPARRLYQRHGFEYCGPFADYQADPNSLFMTKVID
ncbi:GNAT family N-acetyltransferase [Shewanella inventionis]|uniref:GNAT family N-acetyltransferase n=1 Tax=Shewanella inventionis TaxID=1738770 RepID=UPI001CBAB439|nr:GNAT family N-acetyltransferase [Shewanella inventionis]UAL41460.1 GNAT family N-acetyltransferase [Shewanella inventionis]